MGGDGLYRSIIGKFIAIMPMQSLEELLVDLLLYESRCALFGIPHIQISLTLRLFFLLQHSISYSRIFKLEFYFMKKRSCRESNSRLLIESTVSYPLDHHDNDAGRCNFLAIIFQRTKQ